MIMEGWKILKCSIWEIPALNGMVSLAVLVKVQGVSETFPSGLELMLLSCEAWMCVVIYQG